MMPLGLLSVRRSWRVDRRPRSLRARARFERR
jgi:hypothetical protein